ncbi:hypothetical protein AGMMS50239_03070 [Bacteroidia bacterium]|nr:hypothetical protein AGMMS50239_03070 [Bacteroidia bacterium]
MKTRIILISLFCIFAASTQAQGIAEWLQTARTAFENGEYRTVLTNVAKIEEEVGSATKPATAYLRIMSHYRLREYEKCVSSANAYLAAKPAQDETLTEIRTALSDAKEQIRLAEAARQKKLATEKEAQRKQAALEKEAATEWEKLKTSDDITAINAFAQKYAGTPQEKLAKQRSVALLEEKQRQEKIEWEQEFAQLSALEYVEINGVKWATRNCGLPGTFVKNSLDLGESGYTYRIRDFNRNYAFHPKKACPKGWRLPTKEEFELLLQANSSDINKTINGELFVGRLFIDGNKKLFFPYRKDKGEDNHTYVWGGYWSGTKIPRKEREVINDYYYMNLTKNGHFRSTSKPKVEKTISGYNYAVRCVCEEK